MAPTDTAAIYESVFVASGGLGIGVGFILTSQLLNIHTDFDRSSSIAKWMNPSHPNWIGAWWLPFIIFGFISIVFAVIISKFPQSPRRKSEKNSEVMKRKKIYNDKRTDENLEERCSLAEQIREVSSK